MSMRRKIIFGILIFLVVVLVTLVVIVPLLFNVDRYRPEAAALIEKQTGKPAAIGHLALTVFPSLSIRVDDFTLGNPPGFPQGDFLKAQRIYAVVDVGGLWAHRIVIKSLNVEGPSLCLLSGFQGNWNFENKPPSTPSAPDPPGEKPLFTLGAISNVKMSRGKLTVANLMPSGRAGPVLVEADGVSSQLRQVELNAFKQSVSTHTAAVGAGPAAVSESNWLRSVAYAADQSGRLVADGTLAIDSLHVVNIVVTHVKSKLRLFPKQAFFDGLDFKCYDGGAVGDLSFTFGGRNLRYSTQEKLSSVNVAKLLDAFPEARGRMTGTLEGTVKLDGEVSHSPDPLAGIAGSGQITVHKGRWPTLQLSKDLMELARLAKMGPASGDLSSFSSVAVDFTIANNRINATKAAIVGNGVDVDASGSLALAGKGSLDFQGVARVAVRQNALTSILRSITGTTLANSKMAFPFHLTGTLQNPKFTLQSGDPDRRMGTIRGTLGAGKAIAAQPLRLP